MSDPRPWVSPVPGYPGLTPAVAVKGCVSQELLLPWRILKKLRSLFQRPLKSNGKLDKPKSFKMRFRGEQETLSVSGWVWGSGSAGG